MRNYPSCTAVSYTHLVKFVPKRYSPEEIEALKKNPNVLEVRENRLLLTIEFRQQVYEAWICLLYTSG